MKEKTEAESALAAMARAADIARVRASRFGSQLVLWRDGAVVLVDPSTHGAKQGEANQSAKAPGFNRNEESESGSRRD